MRTSVVILVAIALSLSVAPVEAALLDRFEIGGEWGRSAPISPDDFNFDWGDATGLGGWVGWRFSPRATLIARLERDRFPFEFERSTDPSAFFARGTDARLDAVSIGPRLHHERGALRAHLGAYAGLIRRIDRRAVVNASGFEFPEGEPDATQLSWSLGVGLTWVLPRVPDPTAEVRMVWFGHDESVVPVRLGLVLP